MKVDAVSYVRPNSPQVFFLFTGHAHRLNINPIAFVQKTGVADRNIVIFRDPSRSGYRYGLADSHQALDQIVAWQRRQLAGPLSHVREVFCVGTSSGGFPAIYTSCRLAARAAWSLSGRMLTPAAHRERERLLAQCKQTWPGASLDDVIDTQEVARVVGLLGPASPRIHLYFATTNAIDRGFAQAFSGSPGASLHPIEPQRREASTVPESLTDADHEIVSILDRMGLLEGLFAAYL